MKRMGITAFMIAVSYKQKINYQCKCLDTEGLYNQQVQDFKKVTKAFNPTSETNVCCVTSGASARRWEGDCLFLAQTASQLKTFKDIPTAAMSDARH